MITNITTNVKRVTRTYEYEALAKVRTIIQLTGPNVEQLDALFEELNSNWIAEVGICFASDRFHQIQDWPKTGWDEVLKLGKNCEVEDADLDLDIVEPEPTTTTIEDINKLWELRSKLMDMVEHAACPEHDCDSYALWGDEEALIEDAACIIDKLTKDLGLEPT